MLTTSNSSWPVGTAWAGRMDFVPGELPVTILVQCFERSTRLCQFRFVNYSIPIQVQRYDERIPRRVGARAFRIARSRGCFTSVGAIRPTRSLGRSHLLQLLELCRGQDFLHLSLHLGFEVCDQRLLVGGQFEFCVRRGREHVETAVGGTSRAGSTGGFILGS